MTPEIQTALALVAVAVAVAYLAWRRVHRRTACDRCCEPVAARPPRLRLPVHGPPRG